MQPPLAEGNAQSPRFGSGVVSPTVACTALSFFCWATILGTTKISTTAATAALQTQFRHAMLPGASGTLAHRFLPSPAGGAFVPATTSLVGERAGCTLSAARDSVHDGGTSLRALASKYRCLQGRTDLMRGREEGVNFELEDPRR
jgi:hypothetical protein